MKKSHITKESLQSPLNLRTCCQLETYIHTCTMQLNGTWMTQTKIKHNHFQIAAMKKTPHYFLYDNMWFYSNVIVSEFTFE